MKNSSGAPTKQTKIQLGVVLIFITSILNLLLIGSVQMFRNKTSEILF